LDRAFAFLDRAFAFLALLFAFLDRAHLHFWH
jgi:hypothetical protein